MKKKQNDFRSKAERLFYEDAKRRGIELEYERDTFRYSGKVRGGFCEDCNGKRVLRAARYTPDFRVDGPIYIETKGRLTSRDRTKLVRVKECNPELDLRLVFFSDNKINKDSDTRYSDWAEKHGFVYAVGRVMPEAWV